MSVDLAERVAALERAVADRDRRLAERTRERDEARARAGAVAGIVRLLSASPVDRGAVFQAVLDAMQQYVGSGTLWLRDGDTLRHAGTRSPNPEISAAFDGERHPDWDHPLTKPTPMAAAILERRVIHLPDTRAPEALARFTGRHLEFGPLDFVAVPMVAEGVAVGALTVGRLHGPQPPLTEEEITLLGTLADQAAIAIGNSERYHEVKRRFWELKEALVQQRATADILRIISQSPGDLATVLDAIAGKAAEVCGVEDAVIRLREGDSLVLRAHVGSRHDAPPSVPLRADTPGGRAVLERRTVYVPDLSAPEAAEFSGIRAAALDRGITMLLCTPLRHGDAAIGSITIRGRECQPCTDRQIAALEALADQAVIAIENARLFGELKARTRALARSVKELRALSEVGRAVSSSLDLRTVLETVLDRAVELSGSDGGIVYLYEPEEDAFRLHVSRGAVSELADAAGARHGVAVQHPFEVMPGLIETLRRGESVQVPDIFADERLTARLNPASRELLHQLNYRATTLVPLIHDGRLQGVLDVDRQQPGVLPPDTLHLLETFASQSALAIQNARLYAQIEQQRRQLEEVSRHKSEFLASMSHELRTPLNAIIGFSEVLLDPDMPVDDAARRQFLDNILTSGRHLLTLINDILDLSKVEAGRMELHPEEFDLPEALQGVHAVVRAMADRKQQRLTLDVAPGIGTVEHDPGRFKQVLFNLLSNAVKFTPEGGAITTTARLDGDGWLELAVTDTGIGIAEADQARIFEAFSQIDSGYARQQQGTGLGLALVRDFARLMGGDVILRSAPGAGSTFTLRLPCRPGQARFQPGSSAGGPLVLVVEDDPAAGELLAFQLDRGGYAVERAATADEALALARARPPAAITLDLRLPGEREGWGLLRHLKHDPATARVPVVVISILEDDGLSRQAGAAAHLVKPVDARSLLTTLARVAGPAPAAAPEVRGDD